MSFNVKILRLIPVSIGPLELGNLPKGEVRHLTGAERVSLIKTGRKS